jgi:lipid-A-disaccharide synthase
VGRRSVLIVTGEPSGDRAGGLLARELLRLEPSARIRAVGGAALRAAGAEIVQDIAELSAMGFLEVVEHLPRLWSLRRRLVRLLDHERPDVVVLVDYPDFNLGIARLAKSRGIPVVYYIGPQVWAWRRGRVSQIARVVDRMLVVFPFERAIYERAGVPVEFVGHPLLDTLPSPEDEPPGGPDDGRRTLGLLAGSRVQEVRRIFPVMVRTAARLRRDDPSLRVLASVAPSVPREEYDAILRAEGETSIEMRTDAAAAIVRESTVVLVTSGTATLEAALVGTPLIVLYRTSALTWWIGRRVVDLPRISLVNIVAERDLVSEFLQDDARPEPIADAVRVLLEDVDARQRLRADLRALRTRLGEPGASARAARSVWAEASR